MPCRKFAPVIYLTVIALLGQLVSAAAADAPRSAGNACSTSPRPAFAMICSIGGHGVLVFDIDHGHKFVRRIAFAGLIAKASR